MPLTIGNQKIARLSGPIEACLLKSVENKNYPLLFLCGDRHNSIDQLCSDCTCDGESDSNCCLEIFSVKFLQLLDKWSNTNKVSFYTEFFEPSEEKKLYTSNPKLFTKHLQDRFASSPKGVMQLLREYLISCYLRDPTKPDPISQKYCPTTQINWEYGDLRQLKSLSTFKEIIHTEIYYYEVLLFRVLFSIYYICVDDKNESIIDTEFNPIQYSKYLGPTNSKIFWKSLSLLLSSPEQFSLFMYNKSNSFFQQHSMLNRLLNKKITISQLKTWSEYLLEFYTKNSNLLQDKKIKILSNFFNDLSLGKYNSLPNSIKLNNPIILIDLTLPFLDLYYILQSLNNDHKLSVGYFGSTHIHGIKHLLVDKLKIYKEISSTSKGPKTQERCLNLNNKDWNLNQYK